MEYFGRAKTGKELYQNAEEDERSLSATTTNSIDNLVGGARTNPNIPLFIDTSNILLSISNFGEYTAPDDGYLCGFINSKNGGAYTMYIDNVAIGHGYNNNNNVTVLETQLLVKKGTKIKITNDSAGAHNVTYAIYGLKS